MKTIGKKILDGEPLSVRELAMLVTQKSADSDSVAAVLKAWEANPGAAKRWALELRVNVNHNPKGEV